ncbi:MAG TPA: hypothetical protein DDW52_02210, partial [Planctomycetaceae bacterium]|nr:hypothetical protein [Planctomycetaceae bacterium]
RRSGGEFKFDPGCPSCSRPIGVLEPLTETARCDYAANVGDGAPDLDDLASWPLNYWGPESVAEARRLKRSGRFPRPPRDWTGVSWLGVGVRLAAITDGTSSTFMFGEKYVMQDAYFSGTDWGDNEPLYGGFNNDNHRSAHPRWPLMQDTAGEMSIGSFGSAHSSGVNFSMADGSVHTIVYMIDSRVYRRLGNRRDGQSVEVPQ